MTDAETQPETGEPEESNEAGHEAPPQRGVFLSLEVGEDGIEHLMVRPVNVDSYAVYGIVLAGAKIARESFE